MAARTAMKTRPMPELNVSRDEARKRIRERIDVGRQLLLRFKGPIRAAEEQLIEGRIQDQVLKWHRYNEQLLQSLFQDTLERDEYANTLAFGFESNSMRALLNGCIPRLESVVERLDFAVEPPQVRTVGLPSRALEEILAQCDLEGVSHEFDRALDNVDSDPGAAITAACAIVESFCKFYIVEHDLELPKDQTLKPLWGAVQRSLDLHPGSTTDPDLRKVAQGLATAVDGLGAYRTHVGSAHGRGPGARKPSVPEARLAVHAAHSIVAFALEIGGRTAAVIEQAAADRTPDTATSP